MIHNDESLMPRSAAVGCTAAICVCVRSDRAQARQESLIARQRVRIAWRGEHSECQAASQPSHGREQRRAYGHSGPHSHTETVSGTVAPPCVRIMTDVLGWG